MGTCGWQWRDHILPHPPSDAVNITANTFAAAATTTCAATVAAATTAVIIVCTLHQQDAAENYATHTLKLHDLYEKERLGWDTDAKQITYQNFIAMKRFSLLLQSELEDVRNYRAAVTINSTQAAP